MSSFRFAIISDPHIALPHTIWDSPHRFHLVEVSIPAFEQILEQLIQADIDCLLLPGDLVQHGERENHDWLVNRLAQLPFPAYVVPGNHDVITQQGCLRTLSLAEFSHQYQAFGYRDPSQPYYHQEIHPGIHLISLNSNSFDASGQPLHSGYLDAQQLIWLDAQLEKLQGQFILVMLHHNVLEHLPGQSRSSVGRRYLVKNGTALTSRLKAAGVQLMFTGHLHVQDIAQSDQLYEITTGSLVSYPHPYRILSLTLDDADGWQLHIQSHCIKAVPDWPALQATSRAWMAERSFPFMVKLLAGPPLHLDSAVAAEYAPALRDFWSAIAAGDAQFDFPNFPAPIRRFLQTFSAVDQQGNPRCIDNQAILTSQGVKTAVSG